MTYLGAIKQLHELRNAEDMPFYYKPAIAAVIDVLLMDVQEVKHGRWMHYAHRELQYDISGVKTWGEEYQCSNCGFVHSVIEDFGHYAYCPNCGARMDL